MLNLGATEFYISATNMSPADFEAYSNRLFDEWEARVAQELPLEDYALLLEIEEGSVKGSGRIQAKAKAVFYAICGYGAFHQGLQYLRDHASAAGDYLSAVAQAAAGPNTPAPVVKKRSGTIGQLQRLFVKVHRREMSVDDAIAEARELLGNDAEESPEFMARLTESLQNTQLRPEQIGLPLAGLESEMPVDESANRRLPKAPKPTPVLPPSNQLRVEIWKESKRGRKKIRVINLH